MSLSLFATIYESASELVFSVSCSCIYFSPRNADSMAAMVQSNAPI